MEREQAKMIRERKIRQARYLLEDFKQGIQKLKRSSLGFIILGFLWIIPAYFGGVGNYGHVLASLGVGIGLFFLADSQIEWQETRNIIIGIIAFLSAILLEFILLGIPYRIIPIEMASPQVLQMIDAIGNSKVGLFGSIILALNYISPSLYFLLKICLVAPFFIALYYKTKIDRLSDVVKHQAGIKSL